MPRRKPPQATRRTRTNFEGHALLGQPAVNSAEEHLTFEPFGTFRKIDDPSAVLALDSLWLAVAKLPQDVRDSWHVALPTRLAITVTRSLDAEELLREHGAKKLARSGRETASNVTLHAHRSTTATPASVRFTIPNSPHANSKNVRRARLVLQYAPDATLRDDHRLVKQELAATFNTLPERIALTPPHTILGTVPEPLLDQCQELPEITLDALNAANLRAGNLEIPSSPDGYYRNHIGGLGAYISNRAHSNVEPTAPFLASAHELGYDTSSFGTRS